jgi:polysaccharide export outer membrane protein
MQSRTLRSFGRSSAPGLVLLLLSGLMAAQAPAEPPAHPQSTQPPPVQSQGSPVESAARPASQMAVGSPQGNPEAQNSAAVTPKANASSVPSVTPDSPHLKLGAGDLIEVSVYNVPELATKARVGNSGDVYLPLIDYVHVADLTTEEAQMVIQKRLEDGGFVRSPHVTIYVDESASQGVTLLGEVNKPGVYPNMGDHTLYDLISVAGGFTASAARKVSIIHRGQTESVHLLLPRNLADDLTNNVDILPGDTIMVPRAPIIYVVGDVGHPSGLLVDNGSLTVLQAIALAGGANKTAKMGGVRIIRKGPEGMTETQVPLKKMLEAKAPDITLQGDDILFVPISGGRVLAARTLEAAMSAATAVSIYSVHP